MKIEFVEIGNFRKLESVRIDFSDKTTVFVGANNSGKTSAMLALRYFLLEKRERIRFSFNDIPLSHWSKINAIGYEWEMNEIASEDSKIKGVPIEISKVQLQDTNERPASMAEQAIESRKQIKAEECLDENVEVQLKEEKELNEETCKQETFSVGQIDEFWDSILPFLDIWLSIENGEAFFVEKLIPTLDWNGKRLGVRMRLELNEDVNLQRDYLERRKIITNTKKKSLSTNEKEGISQVEVLWPRNLSEFLQRRFKRYFRIKSYILDPDLPDKPELNDENPWRLIGNTDPIEGDPFKGLIQIDEISAQRGFGQSHGTNAYEDEHTSARYSSTRKMSEQLSDYWDRHLNPDKNPNPNDIGALVAIEQAQQVFNKQLEIGFKNAIDEIEEMGYPGITDPKLKISTRLSPVDGLNHSAAVQYTNTTADENSEIEYSLPEDSNGLGYQNLISMIFRLMSFRDRWLGIGKDHNVSKDKRNEIPRLHIVLIEEPEAYLHVQVQQVFIRKAFEVLRKNKLTEGSSEFSTQLIVSTHSSHIAHECNFDQLRYFRRLPSTKNRAPTSKVVNLSTVFGTDYETMRFVTRYIKVTHCELLFADAAIFVEGPTERMLVPFFIDHNSELSRRAKLKEVKYPEKIPNQKYLDDCFISWLEIGGSHSHRLLPLIKNLGLNTLIITDLDSKNNDNLNVSPKRGAGHTTRNQLLKKHCPGVEDVDILLDLPDDKKIDPNEKQYFCIRVAYQCPVKINFNKVEDKEALSSTFETALVLENNQLIASNGKDGLWKEFKNIIEEKTTVDELSDSLHSVLKKSDGKAKFALDLLELDNPEKLKPPKYILDGLKWLLCELNVNHEKKDNSNCCNEISREVE